MSRADRPAAIDVLRAHLDLLEQDMHTCLIARVQSYDAPSQTADLVPVVRHAVEQPDGSTVYEELPVLPHVPVAMPRAGDWFIGLPVAPGDFCVVHVFDAASEHWRAGDGSDQYPGDVERRSLGSCVAYPVNCYPRTAALAHAPPQNGDLVIGSDEGTGTRLAFKPDGRVVLTQGATVVLQVDANGTVQLGGNAATQLLALANLVTAQLNALKGAISGAAVVPNDGGAAFKANILSALASWPGNVAATKAKAL